jgi:RNA polymerase sigma-70 factor (ECF subfamily)
LPKISVGRTEVSREGTARAHSSSTNGNGTAGRTGRNGSSDHASDSAALLRRIKAGDQSAMAEIYDRFAPLAYAAALRVLGDSGSAEDVLQEVLVQLWRNPSAFDAGRGSLAAWLSVIARNRAIDQRRKQRPASAVEDVDIVVNCELDDDVARAEAIGRVRAVLASLSCEQRDALEKAFFDGMTHAEIAAATGEPLGTIKTRIRSALIALRRALMNGAAHP